ncbi:MAG: hypothetical protein JW827_09950 [Spirochaetes bacterium]|nr:hypothetical protein [Spirochaetota bacterium]
MINFLFNINRILIFPAVLILLLLFKKEKVFFFTSALIVLCLYSFINLLIYIQIDVMKSPDPIITHMILIITLTYIILKVTDEDWRYPAYRYLTRIILFSFGIYFLIENIPLLRGLSILAVAFLSFLPAHLLGFKGALGGIDYAGYSLFWQQGIGVIKGNIFEVNVPIEPTDIGIVLGCTGVREILLFYFLIHFIEADVSLKRRVFFVVALILFTANIVRNTVVIYFTGGKDVPFETTHHTAGGLIIFLALLFSIIYTLFKLPQINSYMEDILRLKKIT